MSWATLSSFSMAAFEAVVFLSSSTYSESECCMPSNESRSRRISSLCLMRGRGVLKFPLATSPAESASFFSGLVARLMMMRPTMRVTNRASAMSISMMVPATMPMPST